MHIEEFIINFCTGKKSIPNINISKASCANAWVHLLVYYDDSMPPIYDDYIDESGFGRVSTLGSDDPTILEDVESHCDNYESAFGEVMTLFSSDSTILEEVSIDYDENKVATYDDYCDEIVVCAPTPISRKNRVK